MNKPHASDGSHNRGQLRAPDAEAGGFTVHMGYVFFIVLPRILIWLFLGWRRLWLLLPWYAALWIFFFVVALVEDRWRMVTAEDVASGVPARCSKCGHELDISTLGDRYTVRCPICGSKQKGIFGPQSPPAESEGLRQSREERG